VKKVEGNDVQKPETRNAVSEESGTKAALKVIEDKERDITAVPEDGDDGKVFQIFSGHMFAYATACVWVSLPSIAIS
jgi:hypothetical protein